LALVVPLNASSFQLRHGDVRAHADQRATGAYREQPSESMTRASHAEDHDDIGGRVQRDAVAAEHHELRQRGRGRIDELGNEREEEEGSLDVQGLDDDAFQERAPALRRLCDLNFDPTHLRVRLPMGVSHEPSATMPTRTRARATSEAEGQLAGVGGLDIFPRDEDTGGQSPEGRQDLSREEAHVVLAIVVRHPAYENTPTQWLLPVRRWMSRMRS
jgi:hypothetical protein